MSSERRYCMIVGKPSPTLRRLQRVLQRGYEVIIAGNEDAAELAATAFHPTMAVIPEECGNEGVQLAARLDAAAPGIAIVRHIGVSTPVELAEPASPTQVPTAVDSVASAAIAADSERCSQGQINDSMAHTTCVTERERQVLTLLIRGLSMKEVARRLAISPRTVAFHKYRAMASNGLHSNADLLSFAFREGILTQPDQDGDAVCHVTGCSAPA